MPMPKDRGRKRIPRKTPGGKQAFLIEKGKRGIAACAACKNQLQGTTTKRNVAKSMRTPSRLFGGNMCAKCTEKVISIAALVESNELRTADVDLKYREKVKQLVGEK
ncbi:50S ribosomal protein L34e [Candidatus Micrarchaeota archaeon]|nr:50S ribosomal protein L34e [Candidatus Micrarchaeota archaeon]